METLPGPSPAAACPDCLTQCSANIPVTARLEMLLGARAGSGAGPWARGGGGYGAEPAPLKALLVFVVDHCLLSK